MENKKHGGKRSNAGRLPQFTKKGGEWKAVYIKVPKENHAELFEICKNAVKNYFINQKSPTN